MKEKKLVKLLQRLDSKELNLLDHYFSSPLLGNSPTAQRFLQLYLAHIRKNTTEVEPLDFYKALYPGREVTENWLALFNNLQARILKMVWDFLDLRAFQDDPIAQGFCRIQACEQKLDPKGFLKVVGKTLSKANMKEGFGKYLFEYYFTTRWNSYVNENHLENEDSQLEQVLFVQEKFFLLERTKYACAIIGHKLPSEKSGVLSKGKFPELYGPPSPDWAPIVKAYYHCFHMLNFGVQEAASPPSKESFGHFQKLRHFLKGHQEFANFESNDLYTYALNYCSLQYNKGHQINLSIEDYKALLDEMIERGMLLDKGKIPIIHLKNTVKVMLDWGEVVWVEAFLERFRGKVVDDPDEVYWDFNWAVLQFRKGKFRDVLRIFDGEFFRHCKNSFFKITAKIYEIKCLYELGEYDTNEYRIEALRMDLRRKRTTKGASYRIYFQFCRYMRKLNMACNALSPKKEQEAGRIVEMIVEDGATRQFDWVFKKAEGLLGGG